MPFAGCAATPSPNLLASFVKAIHTHIHKNGTQNEM